MNDFIFFAETYFSWIPAWSIAGLASVLIACTLIWGLLRMTLGRSRVHGRVGLWILRGCTVALLAVILLGPTIVDEQPGAAERSQMIYLVDGSESMKLGQDASRWQVGLQFIAAGQRAAGDRYAGDSQGFRFGHRLQPLRSGATATTQIPDIAVISQRAAGDEAIDALEGPDASDSRLAEALRQLLPQVSGGSTAGVVLVSDGRVRASESVEQLAEHLGDAGVPLHVVPVGEATGIGDIAVVSLVIPPRVRKYTQEEVQVFLRSFGFTGHRTNVRLTRRSDADDGNAAPLASVPVTLSGGAQSVSLTFRVGEKAEDLVVVVDPVEGELTERNNRVATRVEIDRTKIRVLYIEGGSLVFRSAPVRQQGLSLSGLFSSGASAVPLTIEGALQADEDLECKVLITQGSAPPRSMNRDDSGLVTGFPKTRAELFAYDCVVLSNVGPNVLEEEQSQWLTQWVTGRGGGLVITGSQSLLDEAWQDSPLLPLLPVQLANSGATTGQPVEVNVASEAHPIWQLQLEQRANDQLLEQLPPLMVGDGIYQPKPTAEVLAVREDNSAAVIAAQRAGRGRVIVSSAALGGAALSDLAMAWGPQPERAAAKLWRNIIYWATEGSSTGRRRLVAQLDKHFYRPGEPLTIFATAYDEAALRTTDYRVWAMFEPASLDDMSLYSPILWPDNTVRESGEASPRIAWGEELPLKLDPNSDGYSLPLMLSQTGDAGDNGLRIEMTAYEGGESNMAFGHGTQVDSTSLAIQILSDPYEQQNPLPNHELLERLAAITGGQVLREPNELAELLKQRQMTYGPPQTDAAPAWSHWWLWITLLGLMSTEWIWRRLTGLA